MNKLSAAVVTVFSLLASACGPSLSTMHSTAASGHVQADAPIHARHSVVIEAPREVVWSVLTDVATWPSWQTSVTEAHAPAKLAPGATFRWTNKGSAITSTLARVTDQREIAWTGSVSIAKAIHVWRLEEPSAGRTRVDVEETMDGFMLTAFYGQADLDADVSASLDALRKAAEKRAR